MVTVVVIVANSSLGAAVDGASIGSAVAELFVAEKPKSEIYQDLLPLINSGAVDLLDNDRLQQQLVTLERCTSRGGRDSIDHTPGAHDDVANAVAGALVTAFKEPASQTSIGRSIGASSTGGLCDAKTLTRSPKTPS
jgi:hypothetical protein